MKCELKVVLNPFFILPHLWNERRLVKRFAKRDFETRYKGTFLGLCWSVIMPLMMLLAYTFVFSVIFQAKWGTTGEESRALFAIVLFGSLIPYNIFNEAVASSSGLIVGNPNLVKKVVFPLEILPLSRLLSVILQSLPSLIILFIGIAFVGELSWNILYLPLVMVPLFLIALGISYLVSSLTVFVRDTGQVVGVLLTLLLFLSPIFYPLSAIPPSVKRWVMANPFALLIEEFRGVMILGRSPDIVIICCLWLVGIVIAILGFAWFMKSKRSFADVL